LPCFSKKSIDLFNLTSKTSLAKSACCSAMDKSDSVASLISDISLFNSSINFLPSFTFDWFGS